MESGEHVAGFLPYEYYSDLKIEGKPVYAQAKLTANISGKYGIFYNNFMLGGEWSTKGNEGKEKVLTQAILPPKTFVPVHSKTFPISMNTAVSSKIK